MKFINAYLLFDGNCKEAMEFYAKCLGAQLETMPFSQAPGTAKEAADRTIHARLSKGDAVLMASDCPPGMPVKVGENVQINVQCESDEEIERYFGGLVQDGTVRLPLQNMFWGAKFGMLTDKYGVQWMFNYELPKK